MGSGEGKVHGMKDRDKNTGGQTTGDLADCMCVSNVVQNPWETRDRGDNSELPMTPESETASEVAAVCARACVCGVLCSSMHGV